MIYVITECDDRQCVKIGYTKTRDEKVDVTAIRKRLANIQVCTWRRLECILMMDGDQVIEAELHRTFAAYHVGGEWFSNAGELARWLRCSETEPVRMPRRDRAFGPKQKHVPIRKYSSLLDTRATARRYMGIG